MHFFQVFMGSTYYFVTRKKFGAFMLYLFLFGSMSGIWTDTLGPLDKGSLGNLLLKGPHFGREEVGGQA